MVQSVVQTQLVLPTARGRARLGELEHFSKIMTQLADQVGMKLSSRGWGYQLEGFKFITKADFDRVEALINECRQNGLLPVDFVAEEDARAFSGVETPTQDSPQQHLGEWIKATLQAEEYYTPDWWEDEEYYIQMVVEKIDLKTLFGPICKQYHVPIATSRGWSSLLQRAEYARRFSEAEANGLDCVLLYCGDHDPDGLRISECLRDNLEQLQDAVWSDGTEGYDPTDLTIDRFGLNYDFIEENQLTWIDNLITGSGKDLASPSHPNHNQPYVQEYLRKFGARKCEANALVIVPDAAQNLCRETIEKYLDSDALDRFEAKRQEIRDILTDFKKKTGLQDTLEKSLELIEKETQK
jgi:hypothetical protein